MVQKEVPIMASWGLLGDFLGTSWGLPGDFLGSSWGLPGVFLGLSRKVSGQRGLPDIYETTLHSLHYTK